jgi:hypothetical protein
MRYDKNIIRSTTSGEKYYKYKIYPNIPLSDTDEYIITTSGDRLDIIANNYYKDPELWFIISIANNNVTKGSIFPKPGTQLRIPVNINSVLKLIDDANSINYVNI